jgi:hypothetical protein
MTAMLFVIILYLLLILGSLSGAGVLILAGALPDWAAPMQVAFLCALIGRAGGCVYCLRVSTFTDVSRKIGILIGTLGISFDPSLASFVGVLASCF